MAGVNARRSLRISSRCPLAANENGCSPAPSMFRRLMAIHAKVYSSSFITGKGPRLCCCRRTC